VVAERIRQDFAQSGVAPACTVSIGLTDRQHEDDTIDTLIARADAALYRAKTAGRNRVESG
jgi:diguanylate cyclase (GGDEF)-like protein